MGSAAGRQSQLLFRCTLLAHSPRDTTEKNNTEITWCKLFTGRKEIISFVFYDNTFNSKEAKQIK